MALSAKLLPRPAGLRAPQCRRVVWRVAAQNSGHVAAGPSRNVTMAAGPAMALSISRRDEQCPRLPRLALAHFVPGRGVSTSAKQSGKRSVQSERAATAAHLPTPKAIAAHLDEYVIGQTRAKRALSVGVYNHYLKVAAQERKREGMAAMAAAEEMEAAAAAMRAMAEQEQADMATASVDSNERDQAGRKGSSSETVRDALLTDYVGQAQGSKRWSPEDQKRSISMAKSAPLAPAYFSSAKWPAYAESSRSAVKERKSHKSPSAVSPSRSDDIGMTDQSFAFADLEMTMEKSNILMIGPSGSGKSHLVHTLAASLSVPFVHADATPLTSAGYVGEDVESILVRLLEAADWNVERAERGIICIDEIDKLASPAPTRSSGASVAGRDVGGTGVQQALLRILEGTVISIPDKRVAAGAAGSGSRSRFQRAGGSIKPWWSPEMQALNAEQGNTGASTTPTQMTVSSVHAGQTKESVNALMPPRKRQGQPYGPASVAARTSGGSPADGSGAIRIDTSNILFVCCGAFAGLQDVIAARSKGASLSAVEADDLTKFGLIPEFVGRLPVMVTLEALTQNDLVRILTEPRNALVSQYQTLFSHYNVQLAFTKSALSAFAQQASQLVGASSGARSLRRLLESRLLDAMYEAPGGGVRYALVDKKAAHGEREVQVYSRSGRAAWLEASEEDDAEPVKSMSTSARKSTSKASKSSGSGAKTTSVTSASAMRRPPTSPSAIGTPRAGVFGRVDETMLRRRARARLTRPSRVGNLRILTSES